MLYHLGTYFIDHTSEVGRVAVWWGGNPSPIPVQSCRAQSEGEFTSLPSLKPNFLPLFFKNQNSKIHLSKVMFISDLRCLWNGCFLAASLFREVSHCIFSTMCTFSGAGAEGRERSLHGAQKKQRWFPACFILEGRTRFQEALCIFPSEL